MSGGKIRDGGEEEEEEEEYDTRALYTEEGLGGFCAAGDCVKSETRMGSSNAGESEGEEEGWSLVDIEECKSGGDFFYISKKLKWLGKVRYSHSGCLLFSKGTMRVKWNCVLPQGTILFVIFLKNNI